MGNNNLALYGKSIMENKHNKDLLKEVYQATIVVIYIRDGRSQCRDPRYQDFPGLGTGLGTCET